MKNLKPDNFSNLYYMGRWRGFKIWGVRGNSERLMLEGPEGNMIEFNTHGRIWNNTYDLLKLLEEDIASGVLRIN